MFMILDRMFVLVKATLVAAILAIAVLGFGSTAKASDDPQAGKTYPMCQLTLGDGTVIGSTQKPCADVKPKNGIRINGTVVQSCSLRAETSNLCFVLNKNAAGRGNHTYTIQGRGDAGQESSKPHSLDPEDTVKVVPNNGYVESYAECMELVAKYNLASEICEGWAKREGVKSSVPSPKEHADMRTFSLRAPLKAA